MNSETLIDASDLSKAVGVSLSTVYKWVREGRVKSTTSNHFRRGRILIVLNSIPEKYCIKQLQPTVIHSTIKM